MFSNIKLTVLSAILSFAILAQLAVGVAVLPTDENQLIPTLEAATAISKEMQRSLDSWSSVGQSPVVVSALSSNFVKIDERFQANIVVLGASDQYTDTEAAPAVAALDNFTKIHVKMLQTIIDKHHFISSIPALGVPLHASLRAHEGVVSNYGEAVEGTLPTRQAAVTKDFTALNTMINKALAEM